jgi:hypothetical protein
MINGHLRTFVSFLACLGSKLERNCILTFGYFPGLRNLYADVSEHSVRPIFIGGLRKPHEDETECYETSAYKFLTPVKYQKVRIQHSVHGESFKSRENCIMTNVMDKFLIYVSIYACVTCFGLSFSSSSEAGVQLRQWF